MKSRHIFSSLILSTLLLLTVYETNLAQDGYQLPSQAMINLVDGDLTPSVSLSPNRNLMLMQEPPGLPSIEEVSQPELRLAGVRINPRTNGPSNLRYSTKLTVRNLTTGEEAEIKGIPDNPRITNVSWSSTNNHFAFLLNRPNGIELWIADVSKGSAKKLTDARINNTYGSAYQWMPNGKSLLVQLVDKNRGDVPEKDLTPTGPIVQESMGKARPARTYQDLLENQHDEDLFDYYFTSELVKVDLNGNQQKVADAEIYRSVSVSPDGNYILAQTIQKPYSYRVPAFRFPTRIQILDKNGKLVKHFADLPLADQVPIGFSATTEGPRSVSWRNDAPATLSWVEALDEGDPSKEVEYRDRVYTLKAPFKDEPKKITDLGYRYAGVMWSEDGFALINEFWWSNRNRRTWKVNPDEKDPKPELVFDLNTEDSYSDPGSPEFKLSKYGTWVLHTVDDGKSILLTGSGATPEGNRPFISKFNLETKDTTELWRSEAPVYEFVIASLDEQGQKLITRREQVDVQPNYFIRDLRSGDLNQITFFEHPTPELKDVHKELIQYERADGVQLSATLYLPPDYDKDRDGPLPVVVWAYPREFRSADAAGQVTDSPYRFARISYWGPHFALLEGYAVVEGAAMPIIGEGDQEPNDTFVDQLVSSAQAVVDEVERRGVGDPDRMAIGGHSYGAFMTANLLAHSDIFRAGIARSGAYNRTLTPFGFQREERTYWDAPHIYYEMSPFMHANKIDEPILLIHGADDNNSGTFPMQSERMYAAVSGLGGVAKLVMLPNESHGYRARESVLHMLWEQTEWINAYVKNAEPRRIQREDVEAEAPGGER
ncbi:MAG: prolyl oligopeptidase family serine peptidase [Balneolaceae bacterium]